MDDIIQKLIEFDRQCVEKVELAKKKKAEAQSSMMSQKSTIYSEYIDSQQDQVEKHKQDLLNKNKEEAQLQENEFHKSMKNRELIQLHSLEKSLVYFSTSLKANEVTLEKMLKMDIMQKYKDDQDVLEDVIIENKQAIEMTDIYSNILSSTMDFFASVISNNLNIVMKVLASVTILMAIPTIIGGIFGMNVALPLQDNPQGFIIIIFLTIILTLITAFILYKKDMFS